MLSSPYDEPHSVNKVFIPSQAPTLCHTQLPYVKKWGNDWRKEGKDEDMKVQKNGGKIKRKERKSIKQRKWMKERRKKGYERRNEYWRKKRKETKNINQGRKGREKESPSLSWSLLRINTFDFLYYTNISNPLKESYITSSFFVSSHLTPFHGDHGPKSTYSPDEL